MGTKGNNSKSWVLWEELEHLRVSPESGAVSIYKRQDPHLTQATEKRPYQIHIPVPDTGGGIRNSLKTPDRETAISKAEEIGMDIKITSKNTENNLKQILAKTDFSNYEQYLEARTAADLKLLKQNKRLML